MFWLSYFFAIPLIFSLVNQKSPRKAFNTGIIFGFTYMAIFHAWIFEIKPWSTFYGAFALWFSFSIYLSLFYGLGFWFFYKIKDKISLILALPATWVLIEWLKSLGPLGNPAGSIGFSQTHNLLFLQSASLIGVYGLSFLCILINVQVYLFFKTPYRKLTAHIIKIIALITLLILIGFIRLGSNENNIKETSIAILQGNHPQKYKMQPRNWYKIRKAYLELMKKAQNAKILFLPETIVPVTQKKDSLFVKKITQIANMNGATIIMGIPLREKNKYYNSIIAISKNGIQKDIYQKEQLMPFGEYVPFRNILIKAKFLQKLLPFNDYFPSQKTTLTTINNLKMGSGICLESIYPALFKKRTKMGADFLFVGANNAWFFDSSAAEKLFQMGILRSVENNRYLIQAANTGLSGIVDNKGRVLKISNQDKKEIIYGTLKTGFTNTLFHYLEKPFLLFCFGIITFGFLRFRIKYNS